MVGQRPEGIGIPLEIKEVTLLIRAQLLFEPPPLFPLQLPEEIADRVFTGMAERRIADIMGQTPGSDHRRQLVFIELPEPFPAIGILVPQRIPYGFSKRTADRRYLQAMGKPVVYKDRPRQREHLRFVLQPAECGGENDAIVITQ